MKSLKSIIKYDRLPAEYQEVEYIEGTGTQYIDTGVKLSSADTVKCKCEITSITSDYGYREGIYGTMESISGTNTFFVLLMRYPIQARVGTSSNETTSNDLVINKVYDTTLSNGTYIENGSTYTFTPSNSFTFTTNCYVFKRNQVSSRPTNAKIYSFEIVGKFKGVPCYRKSDNEVGLYDLVTNTFFTNAGTDTFLKGNDVKPYIESIKTNLLKYPRLPSAYQEVEYIESTGTQYIDTGFRRGSKGSFKIVFMPTTVASVAPQYFAGEANTANKVPKIFLDVTPNIIHVEQGSSWAGVTPTPDTYITIEFKSNGELWINGSLSRTLTGDVGFGEATFYVFTGHAENLPAAMKLKELVMGDNDAEVRNFVPCYRKADNVIGLYDLVNDEFYTNKGTGVFLKGDDVDNQTIKTSIIEKIYIQPNNNLPAEYQEVEYLQSTGEQYIDTGVTSSLNIKYDFEFYNETASANPGETGGQGSLLGGASYGWGRLGAVKNGNDLFLMVYAMERARIDKNYTWYRIVFDFPTVDVYIGDDPVQHEELQYGSAVAENLYIFRLAQYYGARKMKYVKLWDSGVAVRHFVPCYRKADNKPGFYDKITDTFFVNANTSASTDFIVGNDI